MAAKLISVIKMLFYKLKFGKKTCFAGIPALDGSARINVREDMLCAGKRLKMKLGSYIAIVNRGKCSIGDFVYFGRNCTLVCHDDISIGA